MRVLGIETSCDETGVAIYETGRGLLGHRLHSQIDLHAAYGGVVPELASRDHIRRLPLLLRETLEVTGLTMADIDAVAYTAGPGLAGALLVGASMATIYGQAGAGQNISNQASFAYDRDVNGSNESSGLSDDPSVVGAANPTTFSVVTPVIPTLSALMLALLSLVLLGVAGMHAARSRQG